MTAPSGIAIDLHSNFTKTGIHQGGGVIVLKFQDISQNNHISARLLVTMLICFCVKSVLIRSYSGPHFPACGLNTERYYIYGPEQLRIRTLFMQCAFLVIKVFIKSSFRKQFVLLPFLFTLFRNTYFLILIWNTFFSI